VDGREPGDRRHRRRAAGGDDEAPAGDAAAAVQLERVLVDEARPVVDHLDPDRGEPLVSFVGSNLIDDAGAAAHHGGEVERECRINDFFRLRAPEVARDLRSLEQRSRGDAAVEGAVAADPRLLLDERDGGAEVARGQRSREPGGAAPDHDHVVVHRTVLDARALEGDTRKDEC
jgi:hypothetical protein